MLNVNSQRAYEIATLMRRTKWNSILEVRDAYEKKYGVWYKDATMERFLTAMRGNGLTANAQRQRRKRVIGGISPSWIRAWTRKT